MVAVWVGRVVRKEVLRQSAQQSEAGSNKTEEGVVDA